MPAPFTICADFESNLGTVQRPDRNNANISYTDKYQEHIPCSYAYKTNGIKPMQLYQSGNSVYKFIEGMLEELKYCRKIMKKSFNNNLVMRRDDILVNTNILLDILVNVKYAVNHIKRKILE